MKNNNEPESNNNEYNSKIHPLTIMFFLCIFFVTTIYLVTSRDKVTVLSKVDTKDKNNKQNVTIKDTENQYYLLSKLKTSNSLLQDLTNLNLSELERGSYLKLDDSYHSDFVLVKNLSNYTLNNLHIILMDKENTPGIFYTDIVRLEPGDTHLGISNFDHWKPVDSEDKYIKKSLLKLSEVDLSRFKYITICVYEGKHYIYNNFDLEKYLDKYDKLFQDNSDVAYSLESPTVNKNSNNTSKSSVHTESANERFKNWALNNTAVIDISITGKSMFVVLQPQKYTTKANVSSIARYMSRYYCLQTGSRYMNCHIYLNGKEYASGEYYND